MLELFLNPWSFVLGAGLISVPILIHLINRMRFRRVKWAAMEFLLKAQKRMKRKLIFQQLLLLLLRCLMVFLLGLLVGRFTGCDALEGRDTRMTTHFVILDDSPSMSDPWRGEDGQPLDGMALAKRVLVDQIAPAAAQATTPQQLEILKLSDPSTPRSIGRLNRTSIDEMKSYLNGVNVSSVRGPLYVALAKAKAALPSTPGQDVAQVVHVLSDFRSVDWEQDGPLIKPILEELAAARVKVHFVDVAHPYRKDEKRAPLHHDNVAIVRFRSLRPVVARFEPAEFELVVKNFGVAELRDVRFAISVNGDDGKGLSVSFPTLPGGQEKFLKFELSFDRAGSQEKPLERFSLVTARMETPEPGGLVVDNVRHALVEVRDKLPVLLVEGKPTARDTPEGDGFFVRRVLTDAIGGFQLVNGSLRELEQGDLKNYSSIMFLNQPTVTEVAAKNLERYVQEGGGLAIYLGPDVKTEDYNRFLYKDGTGLLPAILPSKATEPLTQEQATLKMFSPELKILTRDANANRHPALFNLYFNERGDRESRKEDLERFFRFVVIKQHYAIPRIGKWLADPDVTELYCMPNDNPMGNYDRPVDEILKKLNVDEAKYEKFRKVITDLKAEIRTTSLSTKPLYELTILFDQLLADQKSTGSPAESLLREFWSLSDFAAVRAEATRLRDAIKYGDPLYLAKKFGHGRVTLITTTANDAWTNWPSTPPGNVSFSPFVREMVMFLAGGASEENRSVGSPIELKVDAVRYKPIANLSFLSFDPIKNGAKNGQNATELIDLKEHPLVAEGTHQLLKLSETSKVGGYLVTLTQLKAASTGADAAEVPEYFGYALNIDSLREGDLRRAGRDDVLQMAPGAFLHSAADPAWVDLLKNKQTDLSEAGWIFLVLLLVLIAEQALAVRLSFHTAAGSDHHGPVTPPTPTPRATDEEIQAFEKEAVSTR